MRQPESWLSCGNSWCMALTAEARYHRVLRLPALEFGGEWCYVSWRFEKGPNSNDFYISFRSFIVSENILSVFIRYVNISSFMSE